MSLRAGVAVVLPVKAFGAAKQRLQTVLADRERAGLAEWLATGVAESVRRTDVRLIVACDSPDVRAWAERSGGDVAWTPGLGLNGAIEAGVTMAIDGGADHVIVAHADLARPHRLLASVAPDTITLIPDTRRDGTNVMTFPARARLTPSYGPGSFGRHLADARRVSTATSSSLRVLPDPDLALDVDTPADLNHPTIIEELLPWLRTHQDNHSTPAG